MRDGVEAAVSPARLQSSDDGRRLTAFLDRPTPGQVVAPGPVRVEGWCLSEQPLARVELTVDGEPAGLARLYAEPRGDLAERLNHPGAPLGAFLASVPTGARPPGTSMRIEATAVLRNGARVAVGRSEIIVGPGDEGRHHGPPDEQRMGVLRARVAAAAAAAPGGPAPGEQPAARPAVRLFVVTHHVGLGGAQLYLYELLRLLLAERDTSCVVVAPEDGELSEPFEDLGAVVSPCGTFPATAGAYEGVLQAMATLARAHDINAVLVNGMAAFIGADLAERLGVPCIWAIHESFTLEDYWPAAYGERGLHPYLRDRATRALGRADAVVFEADATRELYAVHGDPDRFVKVPYGVNLREIDLYRERCDRAELRRAQGWSDRNIVLLCMGTFEPRKAQGALVMAFAQVADHFPDAVLALVGDTGTPYSEAVKAVAGRTGLRDRIRCVAVTRDTYEWYAMADALVIASDVESLPRTLLEAMAFGLPVVATDVFGVAEVVVDGVTGRLVAPLDQAAMISALHELCNAPGERRADMGRAARQAAERELDSAGYALAYRRLFLGLLERPDALPGDLLGSSLADGAPR